MVKWSWQKYKAKREIAILTINYAGTTGHLYAKKLKLDPYIAQYTKSNPKWITDINVKPKMIKLTRTTHKLCDLPLGKDI